MPTELCYVIQASHKNLKNVMHNIIQLVFSVEFFFFMDRCSACLQILMASCYFPNEILDINKRRLVSTVFKITLLYNNIIGGIYSTILILPREERYSLKKK